MVEFVTMWCMRQVNLRLHDELLEAIDAKRGLVPRNAWIVGAIESYWCDVLHEPVPKVRGRSPEPREDLEPSREPADAELDALVDEAGKKVVERHERQLSRSEMFAQATRRK